MSRFEQECPKCGNLIYWDFSVDPYCKNCNITFETETDNFDEDSYFSVIIREKKDHEK